MRKKKDAIDDDCKAKCKRVGDIKGMVMDSCVDCDDIDVAAESGTAEGTGFKCRSKELARNVGARKNCGLGDNADSGIVCRKVRFGHGKCAK